ncbi:hypothetical protein QZH41_017018 [Actinostola sp. cb2023]|nr:hypothetical protein QZH41_017018 [Actinostola sp. cb2023]
MSELTPASVKKLKVTELRSELSKLGLDTKGNKPVLVERLLEAISDAEEEGDEVQADDGANTEENSQDGSQDVPANDAKADQPPQVDVNDKPAEIVAGEEKVEEAKVAEPSQPADVAAEQKDSKVEESLPDKETVNEEPKVEDTKAVSPDDDKKEATEEPMDQTPAPTTPTTPSENKAKTFVNHDICFLCSKVEEEPEVELDESLVVLDKYNSDLYVKISPEAVSCSTLKEECFIYLSGGARATQGVTSGKVCYEVKVTALHEVQLPDAEEPKQFVRVGWSVESANLQLGEDGHSYGYDSTGKKCTNSEFSDFGQTFSKDDVITCYLDLESEVKKISFSKNGEDAVEAFELPEDIQDKALYPHVLLKNTECSLNFGSQEEAWFSPNEGFTFIQSVSDESKASATSGPTSKSDCEVLMMAGLPACGKTTWVKNHIAENPDKKFNVLGTSMVLDRMKLLGVARKQESGSYNKHMDKAAKCLHRLFEIASSKKRNYILDQTNVYLSAQNKKMRSFEGFQRKAIICIPNQDVLKQRLEDRRKEGTELPHNAICDMKRNFVLPKVGDMFDEIRYIDQDEESSKKILSEYVKEGNSQRIRTPSGSGEPDRKRPRQDDRQRHGGYGGGGGGGGWSSGSHRDNRRYDDRRGGYRSPQSNRRGGSPQYGRGGRGGYRDNYRGGRGGYQGGGYNDRNRQGKSYGSSGSGGSSSNQHRQYSQSSHQPQHHYSQQQQQQQQGSYGNYNQYYQQNYQQYGQQGQQTSTQAQGYQQYPSYYQQQRGLSTGW